MRQKNCYNNKMVSLTTCSKIGFFLKYDTEDILERNGLVITQSRSETTLSEEEGRG